VEVFTLLETIYGSFDKQAKRRGVFKIETIGDCYVAVTGLPKPREDHAVAMAKFSRDMMDAWDEEKMILLPILGPDLFELGLRIGMHSGPVTAGVLRGDRARFQLFGDTVNTASRMESNGQPMRIHLSEDTANLLRAAKKEHWIKSREDKIIAKGKGEMQTYWLVTNTDKTATFHESMSSHMFNCNFEFDEDGEDDEDFKEMERQLRDRLEL
jgi:class 3 adenylate cyclase